MIKNTHDAIFIHDLEGNIFITNGACATLTGYNVEELHCLKMKELLSEESWFITEAMEQLLLNGEEVTDTIALGKISIRGNVTVTFELK